MPSALTEPTEAERKPTVVDVAIDACRHAAHLSHEMRLLRSLAEDAAEEGVYKTKRLMKAVRRRAEQLRDVGDAAIYRVKRQPLQMVGAAFGIGVVLGLTAGWVASRRRT